MSCCLKNYVKKTVVLTPLTPLTPLTSVLAKLELRIKRSPLQLKAPSNSPKGEGFVGALMRSLHSPWGSWRGAKDLFLEYIFAKFGIMRVFFRFIGRFFEIKTLPLHKNNGDVLPSLWV